MTVRVRVRDVLLRTIARLEEWLWRSVAIPPIPPELLMLNSPTLKLTHLCALHHGFHSVRQLPDGRWRVRLHQADGNVHAATAATLDDAITALVARLGLKS